MIESEGITENATEWNTSVAAAVINGIGIGMQHVMFEATDPPVFGWYIKNYGNEINLFVDHSQILRLEGLRQNIWGNKSTWGRIVNPAPAGARPPFVNPHEPTRRGPTHSKGFRCLTQVLGSRRCGSPTTGLPLW